MLDDLPLLIFFANNYFQNAEQCQMQNTPFHLFVESTLSLYMTYANNWVKPTGYPLYL